MQQDPESSQGQEETKEPLVGPGFVSEDRPVQDCVWTVFFLALVALTCGLAIFAGVARNDDASQLFKREYHEDPSFCFDSATDANIASLLTEQAPQDEALSVESRALMQQPPGTITAQEVAAANGSSFLAFCKHAWLWMLASTGAAVVLGFIFILLFSYFATVMVYTIAAILVLLPLAAGVLLLVIYDDNWGWAYVVAAVVIAIPLLCLYKQLNLSAKLLDLGADGLRANLDLVPFSLCINIVLLAVITGLLCFGILALTNGVIEINGGIVVDELPDRCVDAFRRRIDCCDWNMDNWVTGYWVLIIIMLIWSIFLFDQIKVYVVAGVVSQWYFAEEENRGNMSIMKSLGFALGQSFGSLVLSSMILTVANIIRRISEYLSQKSREENSRFKWLVTCCSCMIGVIAHLIEWITDFATVRMSITGESFFTAGKSVVSMMGNNLLNAYAIWWFPPIVLYFCSFLMSISVSVVLALAARETWDDEDDLTDVRAWSWYLFIISFILMMSVFHFFVSMLVDACNTIFVCFAIDKDNKTEKNPKAHEVFAALGVIGGTSALAAAAAEAAT